MWLKSPQAIFKDPFRRGNNILVSYYPYFIWIILYFDYSTVLQLTYLSSRSLILSQVMCDTYTPQGEPIPTNKRCKAAKIFSHPDVVAEEPWFVFDQFKGDFKLAYSLFSL